MGQCSPCGSPGRPHNFSTFPQNIRARELRIREHDRPDIIFVCATHIFYGDGDGKMPDGHALTLYEFMHLYYMLVRMTILLYYYIYTRLGWASAD